MNTAVFRSLLLEVCTKRKTSLTHLNVKPFTPHASRFTSQMQLDDDTIKFEIWDTAGQERYQSLAPMYYRNAKAAIVVYDIVSLTIVPRNGLTNL